MIRKTSSPVSDLLGSNQVERDTYATIISQSQYRQFGAFSSAPGPPSN